MTMQSSGPISIGQARNEVQLGNPVNAGAARLQTLAGASGRIAWHMWYGKSYGYPVLEVGINYYRIPMSIAFNANFGRQVMVYDYGLWRASGGDNTIGGQYPTSLNGLSTGGFIRNGNYITHAIANGAASGMVWTSSLGESIVLSNARSYSVQMGPNLWTWYGNQSPVGQTGSPRSYVVNMTGSATAAQPPAGYINGQPPPASPGGFSGTPGGHCFVEGSLVLMADLTWKHIQTVQAGDYVLGPRGPARVQRLHVVELGERKLLSFAEDPRHMWSEEHPYWVRKNGKQWWWAANKEMLQDQFRSGLLRGLKDSNSLLDGQAEFATLNGFVNRTPVTMIAANPKQKLYVPVVENSPIIVNGYVVGGFLSEYQFDYSTFDWGVHVPQFELASHYLTLNKKWIKDYHDWYDTMAV